MSEATGQSLGVEEGNLAEADEGSKTGEQEDLETRFGLGSPQERNSATNFSSLADALRGCLAKGHVNRLPPV